MPNRPDLVEALNRLDVPEQLSQEDLRHAARDAQILHAKLAQHPKEMHDLLSAALRGDKAQATAKVEELGLRESDFVEQDGGFLWLVVVIVLLYATDAY